MCVCSHSSVHMCMRACAYTRVHKPMCMCVHVCVCMNHNLAARDEQRMYFYDGIILLYFIWHACNNVNSIY